MRDKIENEISAIEKIILFDEDLVLGKAWNIKELLMVSTHITPLYLH